MYRRAHGVGMRSVTTAHQEHEIFPGSNDFANPSMQCISLNRT